MCNHDQEEVIYDTQTKVNDLQAALQRQRRLGEASRSRQRTGALCHAYKLASNFISICHHSQYVTIKQVKLTYSSPGSIGESDFCDK